MSQMFLLNNLYSRLRGCMTLALTLQALSVGREPGKRRAGGEVIQMALPSRHTEEKF